jgi:alkylation response protein AidB-like acyl-CoA dehydrogenase
MSFVEPEERTALRQAVRDLAKRYGPNYVREQAKAGLKTTELWEEAGRLGYLGVSLPAEYGGGGGGIADLAAVCEEFARAGCPLLMIVVTPAICGTIISRSGSEEQKRRWLPGIADGTFKMAFAITEPDAGSNSHKITTTVRRDGGEWVLNGQKVFISGVDESHAVLVVSRTTDATTGQLKPALMVVPTDAPGFTKTMIEMDVSGPEKQFQLFFDDVRLPADALIGDENAGILQLFAGLNPERIMAAASANGFALHALDKATAYVKTRKVWRDTPIGAHQGVAHPLAQAAIHVELARLMMQKAAWLYDSGDDAGAGESANMAKFAAADAAVEAVDQAIQAHGGNGMASEYGLGALLSAVRVTRIAPVSREMILNFVSQHTLGLPKSY